MLISITSRGTPRMDIRRIDFQRTGGHRQKTKERATSLTLRPRPVSILSQNRVDRQRDATTPSS